MVPPNFQEDSLLDVVYPTAVRPGNGCSELRYSLRSLRNIHHDRVWVVGRRRPIILSKEVGFIQVRDEGTKWENIPAAILAACKHPDVADDFILMNDDFFIMEPLEGDMPILHKGPLSETAGYIKAQGTYGRGYVETEKLLRKIGTEGELLNYELHVPLPVDAARMADCLRDARHLFRGRCLQTRTLYGNRWGIGGERSADVKIHGKTGDVRRPFLSTNDNTFADRQASVGKVIRAAFPDPGPYERNS